MIYFFEKNFFSLKFYVEIYNNGVSYIVKNCTIFDYHLNRRFSRHFNISEQSIRCCLVKRCFVTTIFPQQHVFDINETDFQSHYTMGYIKCIIFNSKWVDRFHQKLKSFFKIVTFSHSPN